MIYRESERVVIRIPGKELQFGDLCIINAIDYSRLIDCYSCYCALSGKSEWMAPQHFDKYQERPITKAPVYDRIKNAARDMDATKKPERPPAVYTNLKSNYKYDADE